MKFACFDIEATNLAANFGFLLSAVIKPLEGEPVIFRIDKYQGYKREIWNDKKILLAVTEELQSPKYDVIISHYGKKYDIPFLNTRLLGHGLHVMPYKRHIDTYNTIRYKLRLHRNTLNAAGDFLTERKKTPLNGEHWIKASHGCKKSIDYVVDHCVKDVELLEDVYTQIKDLIRVVR